MIELSRRRRSAIQNKLPSGYQQVEYLYCNQVSNQYKGCATNIPFDNEGYCEILVSVPTVPDTYGGYWKCGLGSFDINGRCITGVGYRGYAKQFLVYNKNEAKASSFDMENIGIVKIKLTCKPLVGYVYDEEGNNLLHSYTHWDTVDPGEGHIFLMGSGIYASTAWFGNFYGAKAFNSNGEMYANFHPCRRKSDNMVGFYESVTKQFFEMLPNGTHLGVFAGPDVN